MAAYTNADGKVVVFLKDAGKFSYRCSTLGFQEAANLDDGVAGVVRAPRVEPCGGEKRSSSWSRFPAREFRDFFEGHLLRGIGAVLGCLAAARGLRPPGAPRSGRPGLWGHSGPRSSLYPPSRLVVSSAVRPVRPRALTRRAPGAPARPPESTAQGRPRCSIGDIKPAVADPQPLALGQLDDLDDPAVRCAIAVGHPAILPQVSTVCIPGRAGGILSRARTDRPGCREMRQAVLGSGPGHG